jgi:hypothetical protein
MKNLLSIILIFISISSFAQYSIYGGPTVLRPIGIAKSFIGLNLGAEIPKDDESSVYLRANLFLKKSDTTATPVYLTNIDPNDFTLQSVNTRNSLNYFTFEGGLRRYLGGGYDNSFAFFGGTNIMGVVYSSKGTVDTFDKTKYVLPAANQTSGSVLGLCVGLNGGIKYTFPGIGTIFYDMSLDYMLKYVYTNSNVPVQYLSPLLISFNVGFRKEFY